jgi:hypothetical protein
VKRGALLSGWDPSREVVDLEPAPRSSSRRRATPAPRRAARLEVGACTTCRGTGFRHSVFCPACGGSGREEDS